LIGGAATRRHSAAGSSSSMGNPIIVTGGAGFIGSNIVAALNARGESNVVIVDRLHEGEKWKNLVGLRFADYLDKDDFIAAVESGRAPKASAVVHMGACSATTERDADYLARNNYRYSRTLCEWSLATGARFVVASSAATYGDGSLGYSDDDTVTPTLRPLNMYGFSKQMLDQWALDNGLYKRIVGLKFFNVYGPREDHKGDMRSVVHKAYHQILATGRMSLFKSHRPDYRDGEQMRDFLHVADAASVVLHFLDNPKVGGLFNCGTGRARTWKDLAHAIFAAMGRDPAIDMIDMPPHLREKYQYYTKADSAKLQAAGYAKPFMSVEEGVRQYVEWMQSRKD